MPFVITTPNEESFGRRTDSDDFQEAPLSLQRKQPRGKASPTSKKLSGRSKLFERNTLSGLRSSSSTDTTDPSRPRYTGGGSGSGSSSSDRKMPAFSSTQYSFASAAKGAKARASRTLALVSSRSNAEGVTQIDSDNSSGDEKHNAPKALAHSRIKVADEVTMVKRKGRLADPRAGDDVELLFGIAAMKGRAGGGPARRAQSDATDRVEDVAASGGLTKQQAPNAIPTTPPRRPKPTNLSADKLESIKKKVSGFNTLYNEDQQRLATLDRPEPYTVTSPSNTGRRKTMAPRPPVHSSLAEAPRPERSKKIVDRLQPKLHKSDKANNPLDAAATSPKAHHVKSPIFSSARSRTRAAEDYNASVAEPQSPRRAAAAAAAAAARRKTSVIPKMDVVKYPQKNVPLLGVKIGKYIKLADSHAHKEVDSLKLAINYVQKSLIVHGIKGGDEHMRVDGVDIASVEVRIQDDLAVLRITPAGTMENLFNPLVFDPASDNKDLCLIVLCWRFQSKGDGMTVRRLADVFTSTGHFPLLGKSDFASYAAELNKPPSIDLISSSDDERATATAAATAEAKAAEAEAEAEAAAEAAKACTNRTSEPPKATTYWASTDPPANAGGLMGKPRDRGKAAESSDDLWNPQSLAGKRKTSRATLANWSAGETVGYAGGMKRYRLRRKTTGGPGLPQPMYDVEDSSESDSDFSKQTEREFYPNDYTLRFEYPRGGPKAISVTGSDVSRLYRGEFLNDTIIEFYLRYIGENLRKSDPELYNQCFFFNSFFFKKLSHRAKSSALAAAAAARSDPSASPVNPVELVYRQLKKWTASVELFDKKYIFVPINENIHWYLAIIVNPQEMIADSTIDSGQAKDDDRNLPSADGMKTTPKRSLVFAASAADDSQPQEPEESKSPTEPKDGLGMFFSTYSPREKAKRSEAFSGPEEEQEKSSTDVDMIDQEKEAASASKSPQPCPTEQPPTKSQAEGSQPSGSSDLLSARDVIDISDMHSPKRSPGKRDAGPVILLSPDQPRKPANSVAVSFMDSVVEIPDSKYLDPRTTPAIIILDSLGNKHQQTFGLLRNYMQAEAHSRLGGVSLREATIGRYAKVPLQNNLCDCGVFLLHYVEEFVKDPMGFVALALGGVSMRDWFSSHDMQVKRRNTLALATRLTSEHARFAKDEQKDPPGTGAGTGKQDKNDDTSNSNSNSNDDNADGGRGDAERSSSSAGAPDHRPADPDEKEDSSPAEEPEK
ncbi:hypothetical protein IW140_004586 [Coemansia sp. RSA 1813]|nr:hypothetical protein EV179_004127 [Coemansia sp. RSA 487]KAJ2567238.1 hypothetical protein IW140_004586 [Coemansia sp. RSA 1813]